MTETLLLDESPLATLRDQWLQISEDEQLQKFQALTPQEAQEFFLSLSSVEQAKILVRCVPGQQKLWIRLLPPDDTADVIQAAPDDVKDIFLDLLDVITRREVRALLAYEEDAAGGLMSSRFARVRPDMSVDESIAYLRKQTQANAETAYYAYVLDASQRLQGVVSYRRLFTSPGIQHISAIMKTQVITALETMDQETLAQLFSSHNLMAVPVVDEHGVMKGIVTVDDIVHVVQEEATEDIQKMGGMEALEAPYLQTSILGMLKKRAGWLSVLLLGEMLTASAMAHYQDEIARAVILSLFIPLIISSGGNSGSQATTLVIRSMALGEIKLRDWWRVLHREFRTGLCLGLILAAIGLVRVLTWEFFFHSYGEHYLLIAITVAISLLGVVLWGTLCGALLPFLLRRLGFDPASSSAPFVATIVDVAGLVIYFTLAAYIMRGTLL